jgi:hypothetical protein
MKLLASALTVGGLVLGGSGVITLTEPKPLALETERAFVESRPQVWQRMSNDFTVWVARTQQGFEQHLCAYGGFGSAH